MEKDVIAAYTICNTVSVNIYEADGDTVLAGINNHDPEECTVQYDGGDRPFFQLGKLHVYLDDCMRV
ncbi:hypothetical protein Goe20_02570 [Bacillus phage vB_BsuM-Goe20]|nr:hypothetical protein Goe17_00090 [Bacillus phage vB_BsuM-Goe17]WCS69116.1 hypothetical protein Goe17_02570 [Bacillus phage vB_BsuM-Goe17]WCS69130.1 hypothetical protein Goe20_00080 [Bacillus phage vB_BsuM-Goe20]WCS69374.1 hypothetical protein Goe20_02570 [Bacillus phage vB_BsuM-Goe20]